MKNSKGGNVLASGGYGCVFSPALRCEGTTKREKGKITKLLTERHAKEEYAEIISIKEKLNEVPNYKDYFLIYNINLCRPEKLTKTDLKDYSKCKALLKEKITAFGILGVILVVLGVICISMNDTNFKLEEFIVFR
jgi:hypothetical protein